jgi:single-strand DNA-binding protein
MANVNRVILIGNLTRDPQLKYLPSQTAVAEFGLAINHKYKTASGEQREEVCFIECTAFGKGGELINQYCQKGRQLYVEGRLKYDTWEDKNGGGKRSKHVVVVDNFQFLGSRDGAGAGGEGYDPEAGGGGGSGGGGSGAGGGGGGGYQPRSAPPPRQTRPAPAARAPAAPPAQQPFDDEQQFTNDDIPF